MKGRVNNEFEPVDTTISDRRMLASLLRASEKLSSKLVTPRRIVDVRRALRA